MPEKDPPLGVLVTRPAHQAEGLCRRLEAKGWRALSLPVIGIAPPQDEATARGILARLGDFDWLIFISANAVHQTSLYIGPALPPGPRIAVVGRATARQLQADFQRAPDVLPDTGFDSEALLAMGEFQAVAGQRVLIIKGEGGRPTLGEALAERGALLSYANVYQRVIPEDAGPRLAAMMTAESPQLVVFTSGEGIDNMLSLLDATSRAWLCKMTWLVIHPRLATLAQQAGCNNEIIVSDGPGDENIVQCIQQWLVQ